MLFLGSTYFLKSVLNGIWALLDPSWTYLFEVNLIYSRGESSGLSTHDPLLVTYGDGARVLPGSSLQRVHSTQTSDEGSIPIARSITHDVSIALTRLTYLNPP
jgi:hypothetical protein